MAREILEGPVRVRLLASLPIARQPDEICELVFLKYDEFVEEFFRCVGEKQRDLFVLRHLGEACVREQVELVAIHTVEDADAVTYTHVVFFANHAARKPAGQVEVLNGVVTRYGESGSPKTRPQVSLKVCRASPWSKNVR